MGIGSAVEKRELGRKLEADHHGDALVELEEGGSLLAGQDFFELREIAGAKLDDFFVELEPTAHEDEGIVVGHGAVGLGVRVQHVEPFVVDFLQVGSILLIDSPKLDGFGFAHREILRDKFLLLTADVVAKHVEFVRRHTLERELRGGSVLIPHLGEESPSEGKRDKRENEDNEPLVLHGSSGR